MFYSDVLFHIFTRRKIFKLSKTKLRTHTNQQSGSNIPNKQLKKKKIHSVIKGVKFRMESKNSTQCASRSFKAGARIASIDRDTRGSRKLTAYIRPTPNG